MSPFSFLEFSYYEFYLVFTGSQRLMKRSTAGKHKPLLNRIDFAEQRTALLELKRQARDQSVKRMIDLALAGLETGVPRMTPEEITEYLGRNG
jgi:hypothetical protein